MYQCKLRGLCKVDIKPWLFSKRKGKNLEVDSSKFEIFWDLTNKEKGKRENRKAYLWVSFTKLMGTMWALSKENQIFISNKRKKKKRDSIEVSICACVSLSFFSFLENAAVHAQPIISPAYFSASGGLAGFLIFKRQL